MQDSVTERWAQRMRIVEARPLPPSVPALVDGAVERFAERTALVFFEDEAALTYGELGEASCRIANGLGALLGIAKGMRVGVMLPNRVEFPIAWVALARLGAIMVPINPGYTPRELGYVLNDAGVGALIIDPSCLPTLAALTERPGDLGDERIVVVGEAALPRARRWADLLAGGAPRHAPAEPLARDDLLNIQYTSGTTGFPKGCMLSHDYWLAITRSAWAVDAEPAARLLSAQPWFYMDPQWHFLKALWQGSALYCARRGSSSRYIGWVKRYGIEWAQVPELALKVKAEAPDDGATRLKQGFLSAWHPEMRRAFERRFKAIGRDIYGMTEIGMGTAVPPEAKDMAYTASCGLPGPWRRTRICGPDGAELGPGEVGELQVAGRAILQGYWNKPEATNAAFDGPWFRTGDLARRDERGYHFIVGRIKEMIRRSGENIASREVEAVALLLAEVEDAAAVPVPDEIRGEEVKLYLKLKPDLGPADCPVERVAAHCAQHLARFKVPRYYAYVEAFPRTSSNKIAKPQLVAAHGDQRRGAWDLEERRWR